MDIEGLGEETVELLYDNALLHDIADLYDLRAEQLAPLPRLGEKSADNIIRSIRRSAEVPFRRVLFGLGIQMCIRDRPLATRRRNSSSERMRMPSFSAFLSFAGPVFSPATR